MARLIFSAPSHEEAIARAASELGVPESALETELLEDDSERDAEEEAGVCIRVRVSRDYQGEKARGILEGLLEAMTIEASVSARVDEEAIHLDVQSPQGSILIGREGHTLDALQHWLTRAITRVGSSTPSLVLDVEDYRTRKFDKLKDMCRQSAERVARTGESEKQAIMGPVERKFVHNAVKDIAGITTFSVGREERRRVVIAPEGTEEWEARHQDRDDRQRDSRRGDERGRDRDRGRGRGERARRPKATGSDRVAGPPAKDHGIIIDRSDLPEDDLISDESAYSQLGVVAAPSHPEDDAPEDVAPEETDEQATPVEPAVKPEPPEEDEPDAGIEDELR